MSERRRNVWLGDARVVTGPVPTEASRVDSRVKAEPAVRPIETPRVVGETQGLVVSRDVLALSGHIDLSAPERNSNTRKNGVGRWGSW